MQAKKSIKAGTVLTKSKVRPIPLIRRGDRVIVEVRDGDVFVMAKGIARENGGIGEYIKVYIEMTKAIISCKVLGSETVIAGV